MKKKKKEEEEEFWGESSREYFWPMKEQLAHECW